MTVTTYKCSTRYRTSRPNAASNCLLYVETGVSASYLKNFTDSSSAPSAARYNCFNTTSGGASYSAPSRSMLSSLAGGSGSSATAPAAVFWWDDGGGVGPKSKTTVRPTTARRCHRIVLATARTACTRA
ncbi:hypothetical protein VSR68_37020 [Paraburkholderia phymatum]|uniref:hypothetical protein n=1 Tax=Paraburkholderia phymatum TaxID=148447 RepID=UPI003178650D